MYKSIVLALVTAASTLGAGAANAHGISWSIGINTPIVGTVISNGPGYAPVYERSYEPVYAPAPVYAPVPVYEQAPIYVAPPVVYDYYRGPQYRPVPIGYPRFYPGRRDFHGDWRHDRHDDHRDDRGWRR